MKKSEEILKRNITKFTQFEENDNPSIPYKDALKAVEEALQQAKNNESLHLVSHCDKDTKDLIEHTKRVVDLIKDKSGIAVKVLGDRVNKKLEQLDSCG